jgi:hypothetical protein
MPSAKAFWVFSRSVLVFAISF